MVKDFKARYIHFNSSKILFLALAYILVLSILLSSFFVIYLVYNLSQPPVVRKWLSRSHDVSDKFLSIALDTDLIKKKWLNFNMSSPKLVNLVSSLAPAYLRIGGTAADCLVFSETPLDSVYHDLSTLLSVTTASCKTFTMTSDDWISINQFAVSTGLNVLFDLNVLLRNGSHWDSTNAEELVKFSNEKDYNLSWQLGNEPDAFWHVFHTRVDPAQLASDFASLRKLLNSFARYRDSLLVGPDVTRPLSPSESYSESNFTENSKKFLGEFLKVGASVIDAVTWHQYYLNGHVAELENFTDPKVLNGLALQISAVQDIMRESKTQRPIWLSETGSAYGGGAPNLSDAYVAGFMWMDKLGLSARLGINVVMRQALYGGHYSLLNLDTLDPHPDFWLSVLYKKLVGPRVLITPVSHGTLRLYAHCTVICAGFHRGTVTVFGMNMNNAESLFSMSKILDVETTYTLLGYILTPEDGLQSKNVMLNNVRLKLRVNDTLPDFEPVILQPEQVVMPAYSLAFFVLERLNHSECYDI